MEKMAGWARNDPGRKKQGATLLLQQERIIGMKYWGQLLMMLSGFSIL
jgi:hypothetical protein